MAGLQPESQLSQFGSHWLGQRAATGVRVGGAGEEYEPDGSGQTGFGQDHVFAASGDGVQWGEFTRAPDSGVD